MTEELIREARAFAARRGDRADSRLVSRLAAALEASTKWEWGAMWPDSCTGEPSVWGNREGAIRERVKRSPGMRLVRRRAAGPWEPVGGESE